MTSPLLIVLAGRRENHWILDSSYSFWTMTLHNLIKVGNVEVTYKLVGFGVFPFIPSLLKPDLYLFYLLSRLALVSVKLSLIFYSLGCLSPHGVMNWGFWYLSSKKHQSCRTWLKCILYTFPSKSCPYAVNPNRTPPTWRVRLAEMSTDSPRGLTYTICVSAQHLPQCYLS